MQDPVDPVDNVPPSEPATPGGRREHTPGPPPGRIIGEVVEVRSRTAHHAEDHVFDATVGEQSHSELVIRIISGPHQDLQGRRVMIQPMRQGLA